MIGSPQSVFAEESEAILERDGESGTSDYALVIVVSEKVAKIAVRRMRCLGEMDAYFSRLDGLTWLLTSVENSDQCEIIMKDADNGLIEVTQGPGCSYYHGAACGFSGRFMAPSNNGLASIFDPAG